jgi:hypothetical protein
MADLDRGITLVLRFHHPNDGNGVGGGDCFQKEQNESREEIFVVRGTAKNIGKVREHFYPFVGVSIPRFLELGDGIAGHVDGCRLFMGNTHPVLDQAERSLPDHEVIPHRAGKRIALFSFVEYGITGMLQALDVEPTLLPSKFGVVP